MRGHAVDIFMKNRNRQMRSMFKIYVEPESPNKAACLRYRMNWNRQGGAYMIYESVSQKRGRV